MKNNSLVLDNTELNLHKSIQLYISLLKPSNAVNLTRLGANGNRLTDNLVLKSYNNQLFVLLKAQQFNQTKILLGNLKREFGKNELYLLITVALISNKMKYNDALT